MGCFTMLLAFSAVSYALGAAAAEKQPDYRLVAAACAAEEIDELAEGDEAFGEALLSNGSPDRRSRDGSGNGGRGAAV